MTAYQLSQLDILEAERARQARLPRSGKTGEQDHDGPSFRGRAPCEESISGSLVKGSGPARFQRAER